MLPRQCFSHFSDILEITGLYILLTQILFPSQVSDGVEDFIIIVLQVNKFRKDTHKRGVKYIR